MMKRFKSSVLIQHQTTLLLEQKTEEYFSTKQISHNFSQDSALFPMREKKTLSKQKRKKTLSARLLFIKISLPAVAMVVLFLSLIFIHRQVKMF